MYNEWTISSLLYQTRQKNQSVNKGLNFETQEQAVQSLPVSTTSSTWNTSRVTTVELK